MVSRGNQSALEANALTIRKPFDVWVSARSTNDGQAEKPPYNKAGRGKELRISVLQCDVLRARSVEAQEFLSGETGLERSEQASVHDGKIGQSVVLRRRFGKYI